MLRWIAYSVPVVWVSLFVPMLFFIHFPTADEANRRSELESLFADGDCHFNCILGITFNNMRADEAVKILRRHPWIAELTVPEINPNQHGSVITWAWTELAPDVLDQDEGGRMVTAWDADGYFYAHSMYLPLDVTLADFVMNYGLPDFFEFTRNDLGTLHMMVFTHYRTRLTSRIRSDCLSSVDTLWNAPVDIAYERNLRGASTESPYPAGFPYNDRAWFTSLALCEK